MVLYFLKKHDKNTYKIHNFSLTAFENTFESSNSGLFPIALG